MAQGSAAAHGVSAERVDLAAAAFDALGTSIAVVDPMGRVVAVNQEWRRFATDNDGDAVTLGEGADYLAVCDRAWSEAADEDACTAAAEIRRLLAGERESFALEYPCHSPTQQRWFAAIGTTVLLGGVRHAVVAHYDVSTSVQAREELLRTGRALEDVNGELRRALAAEEAASRTDFLTGVCNRRHFYELAERELAVAQRYRQDLAVVLFDADRFKDVNDRYGHQAGDEVLRRLTAAAQRNLRAADVLARHGGEELVVLLPCGDERAAMVVAEHIRQAAAAEVVETDLGPVSVTLSAGVAQALAGDTVDAMVARADHALYAAKRAGRDRCIAFSSIADDPLERTGSYPRPPLR